jgi:hypothetical protein
LSGSRLATVRVRVVSTCAAGALVLAGCGASGGDGPIRSVRTFCDTYASEKAQFLSRYSSIGEGGASESGAQVLTDLVLGIQSLGDVSVILAKLDKVAPDDIEPDVAAVQASWKDMQGTLGDEASNAFNPTGLVGAMLKGLLLSAESNGSWQRVGVYIQQHCTAGS